MFTKKLKVIAVSSLLVVGSVVGIAAAQGGDQGQGRPDRAERKARMLEKFDANRDGQLDDGERQAMHAERSAKKFAALDANSDGVLSKSEFAAQKMGRHGHHKRGERGHGPKQ